MDFYEVVKNEIMPNNGMDGKAVPQGRETPMKIAGSHKSFLFDADKKPEKEYIIHCSITRGDHNAEPEKP